MSDEIRELFRREAPSIVVPAGDVRGVVGDGRRRLRRRRLLSSAVALVAVVVAGAGIAQLERFRSPSSVAAGAHLRIVATVELHATYDLTPDFPRDVTYGFGYVWALHARDGTLQRIDPATNAVDRVFQLRGGSREPAELWDVEAGAGHLWVTSPSAGRVFAVDPVSGQVAGTVRGLRTPLSAHVFLDALWITAGGGKDDVYLHRVDPATFEVTGSLRTGTECCLHGIVELDGNLWVSYSDISSQPRVDAADPQDRVFDLALDLRRIDPHELAFRETIPLEGDTYRPGDTVLGGLTAAGGRLWVTRPEARTLDRVDPASGRVDSVEVPNMRPGDLTSFAGALWVWDVGGVGVAPIDPDSLEVGAESELEVSGGMHPIAGAGALWVPSGYDGDQHDSISRIETTTADDLQAPETQAESAAPPETLPEAAADPLVEEMTEQEQAEVFAFRAMAETGLMDPFSERSYNFTYADDTTREGVGWRVGFAASDCKPRLRDGGYVFTCRGLSGEDPELGNALTDTFVAVTREDELWRVTDVTGNMLPDEKNRLIGYSLPEHQGPSHWEFPATGTWPTREGVAIEMIALWVGPYPTRAPGSVCTLQRLDDAGRPLGEARAFYREPPNRPFERAGGVMGIESPDDDAADVVVDCRQDAL